LWLLKKAILHGLSFRGSIDVDTDFVDSPVEDSFAEFAGGAYKIVELGHPSIGLLARPLRSERILG
jgi:hypothetical protein